jgi:hypothetical protein
MPSSVGERIVKNKKKKKKNQVENFNVDQVSENCK